MITKAVKNGQHICHAIKANELPISQSSVYRYIEEGYFTLKKIDLPRAVKFKRRSVKRQEQVPRKIREGRRYQDYLDFMKANPNVIFHEMDTLVCSGGKKVMLTVRCVNPGFMFGLLLENRTAFEAAQKITELKNRLKEAGVDFGEIFPVLLTDNGEEFSNAFAFENDLNGEREMRVFFCDPYASWQKPHVENDHTLFRMIVLHSMISHRKPSIRSFPM